MEPVEVSADEGLGVSKTWMDRIEPVDSVLVVLVVLDLAVSKTSI